MEYLKAILISQYEAALAMLDHCLAECREEHWEGLIAEVPMRRVAYHTLFFTDLYLTPREQDFVLRELHQRGGDDREDVVSPGLSREETRQYVQICRAKVAESLATETPETLEGPSGFSWRKCSRGELHIYNIRHIQHHTGAMAAYLRRVDPSINQREALRWVGHGWK